MPSFRLSRLPILTLLAVVYTCWSIPPAAGQSYTVANLGTLGGSSSSGGSITAQARIAGTSSRGGNPINRAFLWQNGVMRDLGSIGVNGVFSPILNDLGTVVGTYWAAANRFGGFIWDPAHGMRDIGTLGAMINGSPFGSTRATGINASGQITGFSWNTQITMRAFLWQNGDMRDLGALPGGNFSFAFGINSFGDIVGAGDFAGAPLFVTHALLRQNGVWRDLGTLPGLPSSEAVSINDTRQVVGYAYDPLGSGAVRAFFWQNGSMQDIGALAGFAGSYAAGINSSGQVVGYSTNSNFSSTRAFLWQNGAITDLNSLIPANSGWLLTQANAINDAGQITGTGLFRGQTRAFLLTPSTGLAIFNVAVPDIGSHGVIVSWNTNIPADSVVDYGPEQPNGSWSYSSSRRDTSLTTTHIVALTGLTQSTTYHFRVRSTSAQGASAASADGTYVTAPFHLAEIFAIWRNLRRAPTGYFVDITLFNLGDGVALAPTLTFAGLGAAGPVFPHLPQGFGVLPPGAPVTTTLQFPLAAGVSGSSVQLFFGGVWSDIPLGFGFFNYYPGYRVVLP